MPRPNILLIITDQQSATAMSCAGNPHLSTPAIDSIAKNGVVFTQAYCTNPVCVPSRVSMFTGKYPHEADIYCNIRSAPKLAQFEWMGKIFREAGYETGYVGKWHLVLEPGTQKNIHGFDYCPLERYYSDILVADPTREFLEAEHDHPFLLVSSFVDPHDVCELARREPLPNGSIPDPPAAENCPPLPANFAIPDGEPRVIRRVQARYGKKLYPTAEWTEDDWRQYLWSYFRLVELVDGRIREVLDALRDSGHADNTIVMFVSDHGEGIAGHHWNQKQILYDEVTRVPLVVSHPAITDPGRIDSTHMISTGLDLLPTLCDFAGIEPPTHLGGQSFKTLVIGKKTNQAESPWEYCFAETEFTTFQDDAGSHYGPRGRMVRSPQFKYCIYYDDEIETFEEQLFDMVEDPGEIRNLIEISEFKEELAQHRARLVKWIQETEDDFPLAKANL